ncbi:MAG: glycosyltransferase [Janthinobacterium sp.]
MYDKNKAEWAKVFPKVVTSFLQDIPFAKANHEFLAPLMPLAFESFDFSDYDLVISVTSEAAKGVKIGKNTVHICYCLTPTRYLWSGYSDYFSGLAFKVITKPVINLLRKWDLQASTRPDLMVAISTAVQKRIRKYYKRDSQILFPPVELSLDRATKYTKDCYLLVGRLVGYKKVDLVVKTFNDLDYPLVIVGTGREEKRLKAMAKKNIRFAGMVTEKKLSGYYQSAKALIMPQEEDFGIVSVEAQSFGVPVIAYKKGGALDTVIDGKTGIFFDKQDIKSLKEAILRFEMLRFKADNLVTNAKKFSEKKFRQKFAKIVKHATKRH